MVTVSREPLQLTVDAPARWTSGTILQGLTGGRTVPVPDALLADHLVLRWDDLVLELGRDYLLDPRWGTVGLAPGSRVSTETTVEADYRYTLLRLDSVVLDEEVVRYVTGEPHLTTPLPAGLDHPGLTIANLFVRQGRDGPEIDVFPVSACPADCPTATAPLSLHGTVGKLARGEPTSIVCWGDSITVGGEASPGNSYVDLFTRGLRSAYPTAPVSVETVAVGGSSSVHWIFPDEYRHPIPDWQPRCDWGRVEAARPDLVTIEFVNDCFRSPEELTRTYGEIVRRLGRLGSEVVLITPPFTEMGMMGFASLREEDRRPYVQFLHDLAAGTGFALADASARWGHLWREGIPYTTLLRNGINHPDDRGHALMAEELLRSLGVVDGPSREADQPA